MPSSIQGACVGSTKSNARCRRTGASARSSCRPARRPHRTECRQRADARHPRRCFAPLTAFADAWLPLHSRETASRSSRRPQNSSAGPGQTAPCRFSRPRCMPVFQLTMKTRQQATRRRSIITPATSKAEMIGSSSPSTRMKASQQRTQKSERASKR